MWITALNVAIIAGFLSQITWAPGLLEQSLPGMRLLCLWSPIVFFWAGYLWAGQTLTAVHAPGVTFDNQIIEVEGRLFGQPSLWLARNRPGWLTELMHFFYATYYAYTPVMGIYLCVQGQFIEFEAFSFAVLFGYLVSYTFFAITPVLGPRWSLVQNGQLPPVDQILEGLWVTKFMNKIMYKGLAHKGGAMPSSHSSTAMVFLVWSWRTWGFEGAVLTGIVVLGMWAGSVYGRYHFLLDVLIGAMIGLLGILLADQLILSES